MRAPSDSRGPHLCPGRGPSSFLAVDHDEPEEHHISEPRINDRIRVAEVRLVGPNGEQVGIVRVEDALRLAQDADLDLVEVAPDARPPVCKIMDYGKFKYEADMKAREARRNQTNTVLKEIRFRLKIDPHDYGTKKGHVERFLTAGDKVKVMIMFRGREQSRPEMGIRLLQRLADDVAELGFVESSPKQDGRNMIMVLGPTKKKAEQKQEQRRAERDAAAARGRPRRPSSTPTPRPRPAPRRRPQPAAAGRDAGRCRGRAVPSVPARRSTPAAAPRSGGVAAPARRRVRRLRAGRTGVAPAPRRRVPRPSPAAPARRPRPPRVRRRRRVRPAAAAPASRPPHRARAGAARPAPARRRRHPAAAAPAAVRSPPRPRPKPSAAPSRSRDRPRAGRSRARARRASASTTGRRGLTRTAGDPPVARTTESRGPRAMRPTRRHGSHAEEQDALRCQEALPDHRQRQGHARAGQAAATCSSTSRAAAPAASPVTVVVSPADAPKIKKLLGK